MAMIDVREFRAKGDYSTDDTAAFNAALNCGASEIYMPPGGYCVSDTPIIPYGVSLIGAGDDSQIIQTVNGKNGIELGVRTSDRKTTKLKNIKILTSVANVLNPTPETPCNVNAGVHVPFLADNYEIEGVTVSTFGATENRFSVGFHIETWLGALRDCWSHKTVTHGARLVGAGGALGEINSVVVDRFRASDCSSENGVGLYVKNAKAALDLRAVHCEGYLKTGVELEDCAYVEISSLYSETHCPAATHLRLSNVENISGHGGYFNAAPNMIYDIQAQTVRGFSWQDTKFLSPLYFNDVRGRLSGCTFSRTQVTQVNSQISASDWYHDAGASWVVGDDTRRLAINGGDELIRQVCVGVTLDFPAIPALLGAHIDVEHPAFAGLTSESKCSIVATPAAASSYLEVGLVPVGVPRTNSIRLFLNNATGLTIDPISRPYRIEVREYA